MINPSNSSHLKGFATNQPLFFTRTNYPDWKTKMTWFLKSINLYLWDVIKDGLTIPSKLLDGVMVPIPKHEWDERDRKNV